MQVSVQPGFSKPSCVALGMDNVTSMLDVISNEIIVFIICDIIIYHH